MILPVKRFSSRLGGIIADCLFALGNAVPSVSDIGAAVFGAIT